MNNLKIREAEKRTIRTIKAEVVRLRTLGEQESDPRVQKIILAELCKARFWLEVVESPIIDRSAIVRTAHKKKCRTGAIICFVIASIVAVLLAVSLFGCRSTLLGTGQAIKGIGQGAGTVIVGVGDFLVEEGNVQIQEK